MIEAPKSNVRSADILGSRACRECGGDLRQRDGEVVCVECGLVNGVSYGMVHRLPFGETYQPTSLIAFNKSLGETLQPNDYFRVLATSSFGQKPEDLKDLGLRARHTKIMFQNQEPMRIRRALEYASGKLLRLFPKNENHVLANDVAGRLRVLIVWLLVSKLKYRTCCLVDAVIYHTLTDGYGMVSNPPPVRDDGYVKTRLLRFREEDLELVLWFANSTQSLFNYLNHKTRRPGDGEEIKAQTSR
jgi:hypothetical protein